MAKILIVEDNLYKLNKIKEVLSEYSESFELEVCHSFTSAWSKIQQNDFSLICLDMSLPTFDNTALENGGNFRVFGGKELARKMARKRINSKYIFITQYKNFSENNNSYSFNELRNELLTDYGTNCLGVVFYSNNSSEWRTEVTSILGEI